MMRPVSTNSCPSSTPSSVVFSCAQAATLFTSVCIVIVLGTAPTPAHAAAHFESFSDPHCTQSAGQRTQLSGRCVPDGAAHGSSRINCKASQVLEYGSSDCSGDPTRTIDFILQSCMRVPDTDGYARFTRCDASSSLSQLPTPYPTAAAGFCRRSFANADCSGDIVAKQCTPTDQCIQVPDSGGFMYINCETRNVSHWPSSECNGTPNSVALISHSLDQCDRGELAQCNAPDIDGMNAMLPAGVSSVVSCFAVMVAVIGVFYGARRWRGKHIAAIGNGTGSGTGGASSAGNGGSATATAPAAAKCIDSVVGDGVVVVASDAVTESQ